MNDVHLKQAIDIIGSGGVIAYPTEAVFGLGCLPVYEHAVRRILIAKRRSIKKGLIIVARSVGQLEQFVDFSRLSDNHQLFGSWPGPVTWLIPAKTETPIWLTGEHKTLAVRVSAHPVIRALCEKLGPMVSTSANPQGCTPAKSTQRVRSYFRREIDYVVPAMITEQANPTEIRDARSGNIIRPG